MQFVRDASEEERKYWVEVGRLIKNAKPSVSRRGKLESVRLGFGYGRITRDVFGHLTVIVEAKRLSRGERERKRELEPDELAFYRQVMGTLNKCRPELGDSGELLRIKLPYGFLKQTPDGLMCVVEQEISDGPRTLLWTRQTDVSDRTLSMPGFPPLMFSLSNPRTRLNSPGEIPPLPLPEPESDLGATPGTDELDEILSGMDTGHTYVHEHEAVRGVGWYRAGSSGRGRMVQRGGKIRCPICAGSLSHDRNEPPIVASRVTPNAGIIDLYGGVQQRIRIRQGSLGKDERKSFVPNE